MFRKKEIFYFITIISITLLLFFVTNVFLFIDGKTIRSPWFKNGIQFNENPIIGLTVITLSWLGGLLGIIGVLFLIYNFRLFIFFVIPGQFLIIISSIITGLFFTAISYLFMIILIIIAYKNKISLNNSFLFFLFLIWLIFGILLFGFYFGFKNITLINYIDVIASSISIPAWFLIIKKKRMGYFLFIINDILYIVVFLISGLIVLMSSFIIYLFINVYFLLIINSNKS